MMFIVLGKADVLLFDRLRVVIVDAAAPVLQAVAQPLATVAAGVRQVEGVFDLYRENERLRQENARLLEWQDVARRLEAENAELRDLTKFSPEGAIHYVSAQVIANSGGAFARNVLVSAGSRDGVNRGQAAMTGEGLVGRLTEVGDRASRVLLITDLNSRIPVTIESSHVAAVLAGDNSERPRLMYLPSADAVKVGDRVVTSGEGGVFPPNLPVGVVSVIDSTGPRVEPYVEMSQLGYVLVVDYGLSSSLPRPLPMLSRPSRRARVDGGDGVMR